MPSSKPKKKATPTTSLSKIIPDKASQQDTVSYTNTICC